MSNSGRLAPIQHTDRLNQPGVVLVPRVVQVPHRRLRSTCHWLLHQANCRSLAAGRAWRGTARHVAADGADGRHIPRRGRVAEWLRFIREGRERKPSTLVDYESALRAHLLPAFGDRELESITPEEIERWRRSLTGLSNLSKHKLVSQLHGIFRRAQMVWGLAANPLAPVEKHTMRPSGDVQVFSPKEVWALVRAAASDQDGALFLTATFTGLRMGELLALRWRDVDFADATIRVRASDAGGAFGEGPIRADGARRGHRAGSAESSLGPASATTISCSSATPAPISTARRSVAATRMRWRARRCVLCASTP